MSTPRFCRSSPDILEQLGRSARRRAFVWDIHCEEVVYDFMELCGKKTAAAVG
jgi:hypothetical protein